MPSAAFEKLRSHVAAEYRAKGYSAKRADEIGRKTAGKTAHRVWQKRGVPAEVKRQRACVRRGLKAATFESQRQWQQTFGRVTARCAEEARRTSRRRRRAG